MEDLREKADDIALQIDDSPITLSLKINSFENDKQYMKFIRNCENIIRKSIEYKLWRSYIIDVLGFNKCIITSEINSEVTIDVHHHIPDLFTLVKAIVNKNLDKNTNFCTLDICYEALLLHFSNNIGYVSLLTSMHEKFHNGYLRIPIEAVQGNYKYFLDNFIGLLDEDDVEKIHERLNCHMGNCNWSKDNYLMVSNG